MVQLQRGRHTHDHEGVDGSDAVAVFLIGMRVNKPWRLDLWLPVFAAMPRMLAELSKERSRGLLGYRMLLGAGGPTVVQYWRSAQQVYDYAADPRAQHRPAWTAFNKRARAAGGAVGIWHETFSVLAGGAETIYADVPAMGLGAALGTTPVTGATDSAKARLGRRTTS